MNKKLKFIVAGSRHFLDYRLLERELNKAFNKYNCIEIVSGGAYGADTLGEVYGKRNRVPVKRFPANWEKHGKSAGPIRNREMAKYADALIAFLAPNSRGTKDMIKAATDAGLDPIIIINIK